MRRVLPMLLILFALEGCAAVALTAGSIAGGAGIDHTLSGISYKTFNQSMNNLRFAALQALDRMAMPIQKDAKSEDGDTWIIEAKANDRLIEVELESLTPRATRMRVIANRGIIFLKDAATSTEIIVQTAYVLDEQAARETAERPRKRK